MYRRALYNTGQNTVNQKLVTCPYCITKLKIENGEHNEILPIIPNAIPKSTGGKKVSLKQPVKKEILKVQPNIANDPILQILEAVENTGGTIVRYNGRLYTLSNQALQKVINDVEWITYSIEYAQVIDDINTGKLFEIKWLSRILHNIKLVNEVTGEKDE